LQEAKRRQMMATKLQLAKFLRDSISESTAVAGMDAPEPAQEFAAFFKKVRV
jgi:hypothetical protein